jgi:Reverse transcriptase (RNA-dependent DNA polymerase)
VYIPKADGPQRLLDIASVEDKTIQQAVVKILNQVYEVDFRGFSYGLRPGRSPHQALDALNVGNQRKRVNWILEADALRVQEALAKRLRRFNLTLEPAKTELVEFGRYAQRHAGKRGRKRPETI